MERLTAAVAGAAAAALALGTGELVAGVTGADPSPVVAVGDRFVDRFAASLKDFAIAVFGTNDKAALIIGTVLITLGIGAVTGVVARRLAAAPGMVFGAFGVFGAWAQAADPEVGAVLAVATAAFSVVVGLAALRLLWRLASPLDIDPGSSPDALGDAGGDVAGEQVSPGRLATRRRFLAATAGFAAAAAGFAAAGRALARGDVVAAVKAIPLPRPSRRRAVPDNSNFRVRGASPYVTPTTDFYRIDTALSAPRVDAATWKLELSGLVDRPLSIGYEELLSMPAVEEPVTLQCVSNEVGGELVGNGVWQGVPLRTLLEEAGVQEQAEQVFSRSVDGWSAGFPLRVLDDDRPALVAYAMNGEKLPVAHGFPARLVVSGLYGYVSATKWLQTIELTTWEGADGYWVPRGWAKDAPVKLMSRIDVPRDGAAVPAGIVTLAGVAWRPAVGVSKVQVSIDDGHWRDCELGRVASEHTWVQWRYRWDARPGDHRVRVRAIDRNGDRQITAEAPPAPDGATGLHHIRVRVTG